MLLFADTDSQELPFEGLVEKLNEIGVVLAVVRVTVVERACARDRVEESPGSGWRK